MRGVIHRVPRHTEYPDTQNIPIQNTPTHLPTDTQAHARTGTRTYTHTHTHSSARLCVPSPSLTLSAAHSHGPIPNGDLVVSSYELVSATYHLSVTSTDTTNRLQEEQKAAAVPYQELDWVEAPSTSNAIHSASRSFQKLIKSLDIGVVVRIT
jgi:hypothetical protein